MRPTDPSQQFRRMAALPDDAIDLARAALLIATTEYADLDYEFALSSLNSMTLEVSNRLGDRPDPLFFLNTLSEYLFDDLGFTGNREDYYDPRNSYLNDVLDRRVGIPILLSLLYVAVGKRAGASLVGIGMPRHFLVRHGEIDDLFVDPFNSGILLSEQECADKFAESFDGKARWDSRYLAPVSNREFVARMVRNLKAIYIHRDEFGHALTMVDWLLALQPDSLVEQRDRGIVQFQLGNYVESRLDLEAYMASGPSDEDALAVQDLLGHISRQLGG